MEAPRPESEEKLPPKTGPGRLLRQARLDLRLAPEDVAQILHLSSKQINALENDDYDSLPGPTYVRGYLRSYAQLLGLAPEKVIESYSSLTIPQPPISLPQSAPRAEVTSSDSPIKAASIGLAVVILGLVYVWWQNEVDEPVRFTQPPVIAQSADNTNPPSTAATPAAPAAPAPEPAPSPGVNAAEPPSRVEPPKSPVTVSGMILNVEPKEAPKPAAPPEAAEERTAPTRTRRVVAEIPPGVPRSRMVLHAMEESWADIRDARDTKLLYENVPAGRRISIEGVAPFNVFLGNADGVRVEFNGQNYDVSRHKRGQVARFTLGNEAVSN